MADVTGQFGQEDIVLNNAATEVTLKQLLAVMQALAAKQGVQFKGDAALEKSLTRLGKQTKDQVKSGKKFNDSTLRSYKAQEQNTDAVEENTEAYNNAVKSFTKLRDSSTRAAGSIVGLINSVSSAAATVRTMDGSIGGAVEALGQIPMGVGDVIKGVFGPVAGAVDQTHQAFLEAGSVGANFGGNMRDLLRTSGQAGLSLQEFTGILKGNSDALMFLGGSTDAGAKRLGQLGKEIRNTPLAADLARLGYSTADINEGFADYAKMTARAGRLEGMSNAQLVAQTGDYLKNLDAVSKLTGKTKETLQAEQDQRMADAQFMQMKRKLDADGQKQLELLMQTIPKQHQQGLKEILATGHATSEEGVRAMAFLKSTGQSAQGLFQSMQSTGTLTKDQVIGFNKTYQDEAKAMADSPLITTLAKYDEGAAAFVNGIYETAGRQKDIGTIYAELEKRLEELKNKPPPDLIDPNTVQNFKQNINDKAIQMTEALASVDLTKLEAVFNKAADLAIEYLPKAVNLAAENFELVAGTVLGLNAAALLASAALKALSMSAGSGMFGGGGRRGTAAGRAATGGRINAMRSVGGSVMRRFAPLAVAGAMYEGYQGYSAANERLEAGEITNNEATVEKSEAIGGAVGGGGGALAGAAAGAAIGSVVPIVGTAIGGLIGGAIGYWAGSKGGEMIGEQIGNVIAGEDTMKDLEAQIAAEQSRIDRSMSGENEYWGSEESGIEDSQAKIEQMKKDLELVRSRTEELKKKEAEAAGVPAESTSTSATDAEAGAGSTTSTEATDAQKKLEAEKEAADKKAAEEAKKKEEEAKKKIQDDIASASETKKTPEEIMLALNTNIEELVSLTRLSNSLAQNHIRVSQGLSNDAYTVG